MRPSRSIRPPPIATNGTCRCAGEASCRSCGARVVWIASTSRHSRSRSSFRHSLTIGRLSLAAKAPPALMWRRCRVAIVLRSKADFAAVFSTAGETARSRFRRARGPSEGKRRQPHDGTRANAGRTAHIFIARIPEHEALDSLVPISSEMSAAGTEFPRHLHWKDAFLFPVETPEARRDVLIGGTLILFLWPIGWVLNLGNRLNVVARLHGGRSPYFTGFRPWTSTLVRGCISATAITAYLSPSIVLGSLAYYAYSKDAAHVVVAAIGIASAVAFVLALFTLPGCMTVYAVEGDAAVLRNPATAFRRAWSRRRVYFRAWAIALASVTLSFAGALAALV